MSNPDTMYDEALALKAEDNLEGAVSKLQEILTIDENHLLTHSALAVHLQKLGQNKEAVGHALKVVELDPSDPISFAQLSVVCQRSGMIPEAEDALAKSQMMRAGTMSGGGGGCGSGCGCG